MPRIAIAGGGIGGLTAALALAQLGVQVDVIEQSRSFADIGAGVQLAPNATRVLAKLGVLPALENLALAPEHLQIHRARDGAVLAQMAMGDRATQRWHAPSVVVHRADLQNALLAAAARQPNINLRNGVRLAEFDDNGRGVTLSLQSGSHDTTAACDALIGADGLHSKVHACLFGQQPLIYSGRSAWRHLARADEVPAFARLPNTHLWLGDKAHLVHYPLRGGTLINIVAIVSEAKNADETADFWDQDAGPGAAKQIFAKRFGGFHFDARTLLQNPMGWRRWPLYDRAPQSVWHKGRVALLGDAAHPMLPFMAQGSAQAIEDAAALACAIAGASGNLAAALEKYSMIRAPRAGRVQMLSRQQGMIYHLRGPAALARDIVLSSLGSAGLARRNDWLYGHDATNC